MCCWGTRSGPGYLSSLGVALPARLLNDVNFAMNVCLNQSVDECTLHFRDILLDSSAKHELTGSYIARSLV